MNFDFLKINKEENYLSKKTSGTQKDNLDVNDVEDNLFCSKCIDENSSFDFSKVLSEEWEKVNSWEAEEKFSFDFFSKEKDYRVDLGNGVEIITNDLQKLADLDVYINDKTGEVVVVGADDISISSKSDDIKLSIYDSNIDEIKTGKGNDEIALFNSQVDELLSGSGIDDITIDGSDIDTVKTGEGADNINVKNSKTFKLNTNGGEDTVNIINSDIEKVKTGGSQDNIIAINSDITNLKTGSKSDSVSLNNTEIEKLKTYKKDLVVENGNYLDFDKSKVIGIKSDVEISMQDGTSIRVDDYVNSMLNQEVGFETEEEYKVYVLDTLTENLNSMRSLLQTQNDKDGAINNAYSDLKEQIGLGISKEDIETMISQQEELLSAITATMINDSDLSFEEAFEKYTGTTYSQEKIDKYLEVSNKYSALMTACQYDSEYLFKFEEETGITLEQLNKEFGLCQIETFGKSTTLENLSELYNQDQEAFTEKLSATISTIGMSCIVTGAAISFVFPPAAGVGVALMTAGKFIAPTGMLIDNALDLVDHSTDANGLTKDEAKDLAMETGVEVISYAVGRGIGKATNLLNNNITQKAVEKGVSNLGSKVVGQAAETIADTALSLTADFAIAQGQSLITTGEFMEADDYWSMDRFLGEGKNQLIGILTGVASSKINAFQQATITGAQTKILSGDMDGAKTDLIKSGMKMTDAQFEEFTNQVKNNLPTNTPSVNGTKMYPAEAEKKLALMKKEFFDSFTSEEIPAKEKLYETFVKYGFSEDLVDKISTEEGWKEFCWSRLNSAEKVQYETVINDFNSLIAEKNPNAVTKSTTDVQDAVSYIDFTLLKARKLILEDNIPEQIAIKVMHFDDVKMSQFLELVKTQTPESALKLMLEPTVSDIESGTITKTSVSATPDNTQSLQTETEVTLSDVDADIKPAQVSESVKKTTTNSEIKTTLTNEIDDDITPTKTVGGNADKIITPTETPISSTSESPKITPETKNQELRDLGVSSKYEIEEIVQGSDEQYQKALDLINNKYMGLDGYLYLSDILDLDEAAYARIDELINANCGYDAIAKLAQLPEEQYARAIQLLKEGYDSYAIRNIDWNTNPNGILSESSKIKVPTSSGIDYSQMTPEIKQSLVDKINNAYGEDVVSINDDIGTIAEKWRTKYVDGGITPLSLDNETMNFMLENSCTRFVSENQAPLARWMEVPNLSYYIDNLPAEGEIYTFDRMQSFAKTTDGAEKTYGNNFSDSNIYKNVKIVVEPNSKLTNAYDIEQGKYGSDEALYKAGSEFTVVSKGFEEIILPNGTKNKMYVIHLKELSTDEIKQEIQKPSYQQIKPITQETKTTSAEAFDFQKYIDEKYQTKETKLILSDGTVSTFKEYIGSRMGTNDGGFVKDTKTGTLYYAKYGGEQSKAEVLASKLYQMAGVDTAEMELITFYNQSGLISKYLHNSNSVTQASKDVYDGFGMDAFLANWDAVISGNIREYNGKIYRIDMGGSLDFRAQGGHKYNFNGNVSELKSLLEPGREASSFYEGMSRADLINSVQRVVDIKDSDLVGLLESQGMTNYKDVLLQRKEFMTKFLEIAKNTPYTQNTIYDYVTDIMQQMSNS